MPKGTGQNIWVVLYWHSPDVNLISTNRFPHALIFRSYQPGDLDGLAELEKRAFPVGPYTRAMLRRIFHMKDSFSIIAEEDGRISGYAIALPLDGTTAAVESIAVDPDFQRTGLGSALMERIEEQMKQREFKVSILEVRDENREAIGFYIKHGYKIISHMPSYYHEVFRGSKGAFRMRKQLH